MKLNNENVSDCLSDKLDMLLIDLSKKFLGFVLLKN